MHKYHNTYLIINLLKQHKILTRHYLELTNDFGFDLLYLLTKQKVIDVVVCNNYNRYEDIVALNDNWKINIRGNNNVTT